MGAIWQFILWISFLIIFYVYFGYPVLLMILTKLLPRKKSELQNKTFKVALLVSAFNEEKTIKEKIENSLALNYPELNIIVISDGSTDQTNSIVSSYTNDRVILKAYPQNQGKLRALNETVAGLKDEYDLLVFSDANSLYKRNAIAELTKHFSDPGVGCVVGELNYTNPDKNTIGESEGLYWRYEQFLKRKESDVSSLIGANGAIFAMRKSLYPFLDAHIINDFVHPLLIYQNGYKVVYESKAVAYEHSSSTEGQEFSRKVRIINRSFNGIWHVKTLLNPFKYGIFSLQLWSHKLLRWFVPFFMFLVLISNLFLLDKPFYRVLFYLQLCFYFLALAEGWLNKSTKLTYIPRYFCMVNYASFLGISKALLGVKITTWRPVR